MGGVRASEVERTLEKQKYASNLNAYKSVEGENFLDAINWRGMQEIFEGLARKIDPEREKEMHIAGRDDVYFVKGQLAFQRPALRIIELDFDGIRARATKFNNPVLADLYTLKILLHEQAHIATGGEYGFLRGSAEGVWLGEGLDELIAQRLLPEYVRLYGFKNYTVEDVKLFLNRITDEGDLRTYDIACGFIEAVIALFARDYAIPSDNREQVFNGLMRAHFRDADLLSEGYREVFTAVFGKDKMPEIAKAPTARVLLMLLTDSDVLMMRLRDIDAPLAVRLNRLLESPIKDDYK